MNIPFIYTSKNIIDNPKTTPSQIHSNNKNDKLARAKLSILSEKTPQSFATLTIKLSTKTKWVSLSNLTPTSCCGKSQSAPNMYNKSQLSEIAAVAGSYYTV